MELMCSLFDAFAGVGEVLGREEEKCAELERLVNTVGTLSQSVRLFVQDLDKQDKEEAFSSNQVFAQLVTQMQECNRIIAKHTPAPMLTQGEEQQKLTNGGRRSMGVAARDMLKASWQKGTRTFTEGIEVFSGKLGSIGNLLQLPEDELLVIRERSRELERLVPLLTLAIQVHSQRGQKRTISQECLPNVPLAQVRRLLDCPSSDSFLASALSSISSALSANDVPELHLQLFSQHPSVGSGTGMSVLSTREMRLRSGSSSSIDSPKHKSIDGPALCQLSFGRLEVKNKAPPTITVTSSGSGVAQPLLRFVSRELFVLGVAPEKPPPPESCDLDGATLAFGGGDEDLDFATLGMGGGDGPPAIPMSEPLASVTGVSQNGLHWRRCGDHRWRFLAKDVKTELREGDCIAVLLESPPGSSQCGPPKDLEEKDVTCLLGLELRPAQPGT